MERQGVPSERICYKVLLENAVRELQRIARYNPAEAKYYAADGAQQEVKHIQNMLEEWQLPPLKED